MAGQPKMNIKFSLNNPTDWLWKNLLRIWLYEKGISGEYLMRVSYE
jgi:hypothetical protein